MKKIIRIMALALVLMMLAGCAGGTKAFTCRDLTMEVPAEMQDVSSQETFAAYTFTLDSDKMAVFGLKESFADYPAAMALDLKGYTDLVIRGNSLDCSAAARSGQEYLYFTYTYQVEGKAYKYLTGTFQSQDGFWMLQLSAPLELYDEAAFLACLDSVELK